ncbi:B12-binding domain-containing radical SAM protein [Alkalibaculum bacchi]|uniref:B12-binding domain-containing radical SAM protein n=1 Tax=Alkalibaculum bacchi TaxID=645887 RepID=UPI0026EF5A20|nr:B12-binding domain-containing radical SAM protein [Alkalibaculum bacchi]
MKIILTTLNSKYIHTSLSIRALHSNSIPKGVQSLLKEYTINDQLDHILSDLYRCKGDIYGFSCYIWNIEETLKIVDSLKKILPTALIVLGGPEVSFDGKEVLNHSCADIVVKGEGEITFKELLSKYQNGEDYYNTDGIVYKKDQMIHEIRDRLPLQDMDQLHFAYEKEDMGKYKNQILYYEGSRGCPFSCSYCLSSVDKTVRLHSIERIKRDLKFFLNHNVKQVKFVDRTFNCNVSWSKDIISFLIQNNNGHTNFHFEMAADLLDDEIITLLNTAPVGLFQLEVGIQSVNESTLVSIQRATSIEKIEENIRKLQSSHNMHIHLDLIAGLPEEDFDTFAHSFDRVYAMKADMLQLGFLKVLKGSPIHLQRDKYHLKHTANPPYEILSNDFISYDEIICLKKIESLVDRYNNSGNFQNTLDYIIFQRGKAPFRFFQEFVNDWEEKKLFDVSHNKDRLYEILLDFAYTLQENQDFIKELVKLDYLMYNKLTLPTFITSTSPRKEEVFDLLKDPNFKAKYLPNKVETPAKKLYKEVHIETFKYDITNPITPIKRDTVLLFHKATKPMLRQVNEFKMIK